MSVNKFGSSTRKVASNGGGGGGVAIRGERGTGFVLTPDNHYDMQGKKITNLLDGQDSRDASSIAQLTSIGESVLELQSINTDLLRDLNTLKNKVDSEAMLSDRDKYYAQRKRIQDVALPTRDNDAVNLMYLEKNFLGLAADKSHFNAQQKAIKNVGAPLFSTDAATRGFVENKCLSVITFYAAAPMQRNHMWTLVNTNEWHIMTHKALLVKTALHCNKKEVAMNVQCHLGSEKVVVTKVAGEQSTLSVFPSPKTIARDTSVAVSNMIEFDDFGTIFQLDMYVTFVD